jgi:hypothetical protein
MFLLKVLEFLWCLQRELASMAFMVVKLYYEEVPQEGDRYPTKLQELMENAME